jgi:hypothetical protein
VQFHEGKLRHGGARIFGHHVLACHMVLTWLSVWGAGLLCTVMPATPTPCKRQAVTPCVCSFADRLPRLVMWWSAAEHGVVVGQGTTLRAVVSGTARGALGEMRGEGGGLLVVADAS